MPKGIQKRLRAFGCAYGLRADDVDVCEVSLTSDSEHRARPRGTPQPSQPVYDASEEASQAPAPAEELNWWAGLVSAVTQQLPGDVRQPPL